MAGDFTPCTVSAATDAVLTEVPADTRRRARELVAELLDRARQLVRQSRKEQIADMEALRGRRRPGVERGLRPDDSLLRSAFSAREAVRLVNAVSHMPIAQELQGEMNDLVWQISILAAQTEATCADKGPGRKQ